MEINYWLVKSEPSAYSFDDLISEEDMTAEWDGVRNYTARNNMQKMKVGDKVLFYHSMIVPPQVVGTTVVVREAYPDDTAWNPNSEHPDPKSTPEKPVWFMVDLKAQARLKSPVTLKDVKSHPMLQDMALVKFSRLSVQPVTKSEWDCILDLGEPEELS
ncbi:MAG: EVE domain-containing protein [Dehalococcoidia bacterium]|nr:EVE domain-containing protein [Dehalococcoidia bacterium]MQG16464.1 EVE domain-containing protein [SAR202 cluster bacterium]|tara:strand:+ start:26085 stop:26561 length:477 start_codon:yes stop_codon:yes gene_type:complete